MHFLMPNKYVLCKPGNYFCTTSSPYRPNSAATLLHIQFLLCHHTQKFIFPVSLLFYNFLHNPTSQLAFLSPPTHTLSSFCWDSKKAMPLLFSKEKLQKKTQTLCRRMRKSPGSLCQTLWKVGRDDPRRAIHALKVGFALTLVSLLYLLEPLFKGVGQNAIWAVMTVVVVLEYTAGATLCKGYNRGLGTLLAGSLAFLIEYIAEKTGNAGRAIFIGAAVFVIGAACTYVRFIPRVKKNFDYGVLIFLLTFNLITVSSYRITEVMNIAEERLYTIAIGCAICLLMTLFIFPIWSGEDLHNATVRKLEGMSKSIEACVKEYFSDAEKEASSDEDPVYTGYKAVLDSKNQDETLALHASWEPRHSRTYKYPWQQYVKVGFSLRHFSYTVVALHGCLQTEIQTPKGWRVLFKDPCTRVANEVSKALMELANSVSERRHCSPEILSDHLQTALQDLNIAIKSQPRLFLGSIKTQAHNMLALAAAHGSGQKNEKSTNSPSPLSSFKADSSASVEWKSRRNGNDLQSSRAAERINNSNKVLRPQLSRIALTSLEFSEALPFAAFASLLIESVARLDKIIEEVEELGRVACFKEYEYGSDEVIFNCETPRMNVGENNMRRVGSAD